MSWSDHVLPHGPLTAIAPRLWCVTGTLKRGNIPRNMVVYQLPDGRLWIHSGVALDPPTLAALEALGDVGVVVVPNRLHRLDAPVYRERYPQARVLCPRQARADVEKIVPVDGLCEDELPALGVDILVPDGLKPVELAYRLPLEDGSAALVVCDSLFNLPHRPGLDGWLFKVLGSTGFFGITGIGRFFMMSEAARFKAWLLAQAEGSPTLSVILVAHGDPITSDAPAHLRAAAARL